MSFDFEIISAVVGIASSVVAAIGTGFLKSFSDKHQKRDRDKIQEAARSRLTEISINIAGLGVKYQVGRSASPETQVATRLLQAWSKELSKECLSVRDYRGNKSEPK